MNHCIGMYALAVVSVAVSGTLSWAQTSTTATVVGTVTDASGGIIAGATVELTELSSNQTRRTTTNDVGQYVVSSVQPGTYRMTVSMSGFRQAVLSNLSFDVAKSYTVNVTLEVGAITETVTVEATRGTELQTLDATVGAVLAGEPLLRLPRSAGAR
ncbi:MAG: carboxypeptidase-like regulatory domain-containing protein [Bryobacteraceae bacterium]|nr:carboxypeptidase-like regulatory domain-containing protein [Bryobacteraceae bacterium]